MSIVSKSLQLVDSTAKRYKVCIQSVEVCNKQLDSVKEALENGHMIIEIWVPIFRIDFQSECRSN